MKLTHLMKSFGWIVSCLTRKVNMYIMKMGEVLMDKKKRNKRNVTSKWLSVICITIQWENNKKLTQEKVLVKDEDCTKECIQI